MLGKFHNPNELESLTQLSDGSASAYVFFDEYEVEVHKKLFNNNNIYLSTLPNISLTKNTDENKILGVLSGWYEYRNLTEDVLDLYLQDFIKVCDIYQTKIIDLRPHPAMGKNNYAFQIADSMNAKGYKCTVSSNDESLVFQSSWYDCIAGFASSALREVRITNHNIDIIAFERISRLYFDDPKFSFGSSAGIDWIDNSGEIRKSIKFNSKKRKTISEIILKVSL